MKKRKFGQTGRKFLSLALVLAMVVSLLQVGIFAADSEAAPGTALEAPKSDFIISLVDVDEDQRPIPIEFSNFCETLLQDAGLDPETPGI